MIFLFILKFKNGFFLEKKTGIFPSNGTNNNNFIVLKVRFTDAFRTTKCVRKTHYFPNSITKNSPREAVKIPVGTNMLEKRSEKLGDHDSRLSRHNSQIPCYF